MSKLDFLEEIASYLENQDVGTKNVDIFGGKVPDSPSNCVVLTGRTGQTLQSNRDIAAMQFPRFQVLVRDEDYNDAADKLQDVRTALHGVIGQILPVGVNTETTAYIRVLRCHVESEGGPLGEDDLGRSEFAMIFTAQYHHYDPT